MSEHSLVFISSRKEPDEEQPYVQVGMCACGEPLEVRSTTSRAGARKALRHAHYRHLQRLGLCRLRTSCPAPPGPKRGGPGSRKPAHRQHRGLLHVPVLPVALCSRLVTCPGRQVIG